MNRLISVLIFCSTIAGPLTAEDAIDFNSQIKPILSDNCYYCHGPDEGQRATDLRLDTQDGAIADLGGYTAIVPGDTQASELVRRILSDDEDEIMPPPDHRKKLSDTQKQLLVDWIKQGALWSDHWAFTPPKKTDSPRVNDTQWPINFIDHYILAGLEKQNIKPSPIASTQTLLRRLSFDLTGLPPTLRDLKQFTESSDGQAYETAIDRLLSSPHFGERMAVYWLDLVRYADSVGYHGDQPISVSPYRDYVISAFNENKPFDQFTREQLAGDLFDNPSRDQLIASGYNRLGMMSAEGGVQPEEYLNKYASDRVRTTASVWLGVTLGCAECHDHKFDPFSTKEFYEFSAFFADIKERGLYDGAHQSQDWGPSIQVPDDELPDLLRPLDQDIAKLKQKLVETAETRQHRRAWESGLREKKFEWVSLKPQSIETVHEVSMEVTELKSVLIGGENPNENCLVITLTIPNRDVRAFRLEALPHESLPKKGPGRAGNGNFVVTEWIALNGDHRGQIEELKKEFKLWPDELKSKTLMLQNPSATIEQSHGGEKHPHKKWSGASAFDHDKNGTAWGWAVLPEVGRKSELVVQLTPDQPIEQTITFVVQQYHGSGSHTLGHFRFSATSDTGATSDPLHSLPADIRNAINIDKDDRSATQDEQIKKYYTSIAPQFAVTNQQIAKLTKQREQLVAEHTRTSLVTVSVPAREIRVLPRGNWMDKSGPVVQPNVPRILGGKNWRGNPTRLQLADWIVDPDNPLTARALVNRMWRIFFGHGLSNVLDDLGSQGQAPSHPKLLDRLALELVESGWDIKHLVRTIVTSQTYRQSSRFRPDLFEIDPENRLLARQSRFRLDAEFVRDNALQVSGLLVKKMGGRSVKPYQPAGLYRHLNFPTRQYQASAGQDQYRRGLYTHWQRQYLHPAMKTFDAPPREECTAARARSSTPLAALVLLNDPSYVEAASAFADRALDQNGETQDRLNWIFLTAFSRPIGEEESRLLTDLLESHLDYFANNEDAAQQLLSVGQIRNDSKTSLPQRAAWTSVCRAVINMHEFVVRK